MINLFYGHLHNILKSKKFIICFVIGVLFNIYDIIICLVKQFYNDTCIESLSDSYHLECPYSVFNVFPFCNDSNNLYVIFCCILPILSSIICLDLFNTNSKNCYLKSFPLKNKPIGISVFKIFLSFISGFTLCFMILIFVLILTISCFPSIKPELLTGYFPIGYHTNPIFNIYIHHPYIFILIYIIINSIFSGIYSIIALTEYSAPN